MTTTDETIRLHQERRRITQEKIMHIQIYIEALESVNTEWKQFIQQISVSTKRKEEEDRYLQINDDESGITNLILQAKQTVVILKMYQNDSEFILQRLNQPMVREETTQPKEPTQAGKYPTVNLPQLPLPTFSGNPRRWREFWNSFDTAIHQQAIPDIHKLNYLITCLKGDALQAIRGYDITPENYSIVRNVLVAP
uniref:Gag protein n=1 Tax=Brugia malayi TaxID=6279 RepID=A8P308_BRUMA